MSLVDYISSILHVDPERAEAIRISCIESTRVNMNISSEDIHTIVSDPRFIPALKMTVESTSRAHKLQYLTNAVLDMLRASTQEYLRFEKYHIVGDFPKPSKISTYDIFTIANMKGKMKQKDPFRDLVDIGGLPPMISFDVIMAEIRIEDHPDRYQLQIDKSSIYYGSVYMKDKDKLFHYTGRLADIRPKLEKLFMTKGQHLVKSPIHTVIFDGFIAKK